MKQEQDFSVCITSDEYDSLQSHKASNQTLLKKNQFLNSELTISRQNLSLIQDKYVVLQHKANSTDALLSQANAHIKNMNKTLMELEQKFQILKQQNLQLQNKFNNAQNSLTNQSNSLQLSSAQNVKLCANLQQITKQMEAKIHQQQQLLKQNASLKKEVDDKICLVRIQEQQKSISQEQMTNKLAIYSKVIQNQSKQTHLQNNTKQCELQSHDLQGRIYSLLNKFCNHIQQKQKVIETKKMEMIAVSSEVEKYKQMVNQYKSSISNHHLQMCNKEAEINELKLKVQRLESLPNKSLNQTDNKSMNGSLEQYQVIINVMDSDLKASKMRFQNLKYEHAQLKQKYHESDVEKIRMRLQQKIYRLQAKLNNKYEYLNNYYNELPLKLNHFNSMQKAQFISRDIKELMDNLNERLRR